MSCLTGGFELLQVCGMVLSPWPAAQECNLEFLSVNTFAVFFSVKFH